MSEGWQSRLDPVSAGLGALRAPGFLEGRQMPQERGVATVLCPDWGQTEVVTARQLLKVLRISSPRVAVPELGSGKHSCRESVGPAVRPLQAHLGLHTCRRAQGHIQASLAMMILCTFCAHSSFHEEWGLHLNSWAGKEGGHWLQALDKGSPIQLPGKLSPKKSKVPLNIPRDKLVRLTPREVSDLQETTPRWQEDPESIMEPWMCWERRTKLGTCTGSERGRCTSQPSSVSALSWQPDGADVE